MGSGYQRLQKHHLPKGLQHCPVTSCVYNENGTCDNVFVNNGNSDSSCHKWTNKRVVEMMKTREEGDSEKD